MQTSFTLALITSFALATGESPPVIPPPSQKASGPLLRSQGLQSNDYFKLRTSVQVVRHSERSPVPRFDQLSDPDFEKRNESNYLTPKGVETMELLGEQMRDWADNSDWIDFDAGVKPWEFYSLSSFKQRVIDASYSLTKGAYCSEESDYPCRLPYPSVPPKGWNFITENERETCPRVDQILDFIEGNHETEELYDRIDDFLERNFYPTLREKTGINGSTKTMADVSDFVARVRGNNFNLLVDLTDEEFRYVRLSDSANQYIDYAAQPDQHMMDTFELQRVYIELSRVLRGQMPLSKASILNKYFWQPSKKYAPAPKWVLFTTVARSVENLLILFQNKSFLNPLPGASVTIDFYECAKCHPEDTLRVEVVHCPKARELEDKCEILEFEGANQSPDGSMRAQDFENFLIENLLDYARDNDLNTLNMPQICQVPFGQPQHYYGRGRRGYGYQAPSNVELLDTEEFFDELLSTFGFEDDVEEVQESHEEKMPTHEYGYYPSYGYWNQRPSKKQRRW